MPASWASEPGLRILAGDGWRHLPRAAGSLWPAGMQGAHWLQAGDEVPLSQKKSHDNHRSCSLFTASCPALFQAFYLYWLSHLTLTTTWWDRHYYFPHSTDRETEAHLEKMTWSRSWSKIGANLRLTSFVHYPCRTSCPELRQCTMEERIRNLSSNHQPAVWPWTSHLPPEDQFPYSHHLFSTEFISELKEIMYKDTRHRISDALLNWFFCCCFFIVSS